jgi:Cu+-exporting ATPase
LAKDPVCGMDVDENKTAPKSEHNGKTYYFCSPTCRDNFQRNPNRYTL